MSVSYSPSICQSSNSLSKAGSLGCGEGGREGPGEGDSGMELALGEDTGDDPGEEGGAGPGDEGGGGIGKALGVGDEDGDTGVCNVSSSSSASVASTVLEPGIVDCGSGEACLRVGLGFAARVNAKFVSLS